MAHALQDVAEVLSWYFPAEQLTHALSPELGEYVPGTHRDVSPDAQDDPREQARHTVEPVPGWYVPGSHTLQTACPKVLL